MKKTFLIFIVFVCSHSALANSLQTPQALKDKAIREERKEKALENIEQRKKAQKALKEEEQWEEDGQLPPAIHPYDKINPQSKSSLFDEMEEEARGGKQAEELREE